MQVCAFLSSVKGLQDFRAVENRSGREKKQN